MRGLQKLNKLKAEPDHLVACNLLKLKMKVTDSL